MTPYVATITTDKYAACYKGGGMVVVRLKDGHSAVLGTIGINNFFRYMHDAYAVYTDTDMNRAVNRAVEQSAKGVGSTFTKRKWIVVRPGRTVIEIHNAPIAAAD